MYDVGTTIGVAIVFSLIITAPVFFASVMRAKKHISTGSRVLNFSGDLGLTNSNLISIFLLVWGVAVIFIGIGAFFGMFDFDHENKMSKGAVGAISAIIIGLYIFSKKILLHKVFSSYEKTNPSEEQDLNKLQVKRPLWSIVIGGLIIIFGISGIDNGIKEMAKPETLKTMKQQTQKQKSEFSSVPEITVNIEGQTRQIDIAKDIESLEKMWKVPDWYKKWAVVIGLASIFVSSFYLFSGVLLLMKKHYAIKIFCFAITLSIIWVILHALIFFNISTAYFMEYSVRGVISIVIDLILLSIVFVGRKETFIN